MPNEITLQNHSATDATVLSNTFIDEYMTHANGEYVKIYIYLLRCISHNVSTGLSLNSIADTFEHTESDVRRALHYWEKVKLLQLEYDNSEQLRTISLLDIPKKEVEKETVSAAIPSANTEPAMETAHPVSIKVPVEKPTYSVEQLTMFTNDTNVQELLFIVEKYLGKTLNSNDISTILYWIDELNFSNDLIIHLVDYCITNGHKSIRYMEKVALGWAKENISTVEAARSYSSQFNKVHTSIMRAFGITGRTLTSSEQAFIKKWQSEYHFSLELILEACNRTIQSTGNGSFPYADSILSKWHSKQVRTLKDLEPLDAQHKKRQETIPDHRTSKTQAQAPNKNKFNNFPQRNYDYDQLEQQLLHSSKH